MQKFNNWIKRRLEEAGQVDVQQQVEPAHTPQFGGSTANTGMRAGEEKGLEMYKRRQQQTPSRSPRIDKIKTLITSIYQKDFAQNPAKALSAFKTEMRAVYTEIIKETQRELAATKEPTPLANQPGAESAIESGAPGTEGPGMTQQPS